MHPLNVMTIQYCRGKRAAFSAHWTEVAAKEPGSCPSSWLEAEMHWNPLSHHCCLQRLALSCLLHQRYPQGHRSGVVPRSHVCSAWQERQVQTCTAAATRCKAACLEPAAASVTPARLTSRSPTCTRILFLNTGDYLTDIQHHHALLARP